MMFALFRLRRSVKDRSEREGEGWSGRANTQCSGVLFVHDAVPVDDGNPRSGKAGAQQVKSCWAGESWQDAWIESDLRAGQHTSHEKDKFP